MDILFLLVPLSVVLAVLIGVAFWRAVDTGQFDDLDGPAVAILADHDEWGQTPGPETGAGVLASGSVAPRSEVSGTSPGPLPGCSAPPQVSDTSRITPV